jgi:hypothetical protein
MLVAFCAALARRSISVHPSLQVARKQKTEHVRSVRSAAAANSGANPFTDSGDIRSLKIQHI